MTGIFLNSLRAMYASLMSCVRVNNQITDYIDCPVGVRQGCVLSPTLFSMFVNQITEEMTQKGKQGFQYLPGLTELFILLFADDIALISLTPRGLQNQLNVLNDCCKRIKLNVNTQKTKVMVFRKGGYLGARDVFYFDGTKLDIVNKYCYLGYNFTTQISHKIGT